MENMCLYASTANISSPMLQFTSPWQQ